MLKIVVEHITPRLNYVAKIIGLFRNIDIQLVTDIPQQEKSYHYFSNLQDKIGMQASKLLLNESILKYSIGKGTFRNEGCLTFDGITDPLASIFYLLTRMEEYDYTNYDHHDRFQSKDSVLFRFEWERKLMVERWIDAFLQDVSDQLNTSFSIKKQPLEFILSVDIDNTFAFKWKPKLRIFGSYFKDLLHLDFQRLFAKTKTLLGLQKDPYDTFDIIENYQKRGIKVQLFWLLGDFSRYDRNLSNRSRKHLNFIRQQAKRFNIGLHPSYESNLSRKLLQKEKDILDHAVGKTTTKSRQHFLKLKFPETYQKNIKIGLKEDFTMGFGDQLGFRSGTLRNYPFFDLTTNQVTDYQIYPFAYMDGTFADYLKLTPVQSIELIHELVAEASTFGGKFIVIWHNESLSEWHRWAGWRIVLDKTIKLIDEANH